MRKPITLLLDDSRSEREKLLVDELEKLGRTRQEFLRELIMASFEMYRDDPNRFKILHASLTFSGDLNNGFSRLATLLSQMDLDPYKPQKEDEAVAVESKTEVKDDGQDSPSTTPNRLKGYVQ